MLPQKFKQGQRSRVGFAQAKHQAQGHWFEILTASGIPSDCLTNKHKPCPGCGGRDRFRWHDKNGNGGCFCSEGGN